MIILDRLPADQYRTGQNRGQCLGLIKDLTLGICLRFSHEKPGSCLRRKLWTLVITRLHLTNIPTFPHGRHQSRSYRLRIGKRVRLRPPSTPHGTLPSRLPPPSLTVLHAFKAEIQPLPTLQLSQLPPLFALQRLILALVPAILPLVQQDPKVASMLQNLAPRPSVPQSQPQHQIPRTKHGFKVWLEKRGKSVQGISTRHM